MEIFEFLKRFSIIQTTHNTNWIITEFDETEF